MEKGTFISIVALVIAVAAAIVAFAAYFKRRNYSFYDDFEDDMLDDSDDANLDYYATPVENIPEEQPSTVTEEADFE